MILRGLGTLAGFLILWEAIIRITEVPHFIFPSPLGVAQAFYDWHMLIWENFLITAGKTVAGLALGALFGALNAITLLRSALARRWLLPVFVFSQAVPVFIFMPILVHILDFGLLTQIVMMTLVVYFPVTSAFYDGLRRTDPGLLEMARVMGARPRRLLWQIRVPGALPALGSGLRLAAAFAPVGAIIGEWAGGTAGLGYHVDRANGLGKYALSFALTMVIAAMGLTLYALVSRLTRRMAPWSRESH